MTVSLSSPSQCQLSKLLFLSSRAQTRSSPSQCQLSELLFSKLRCVSGVRFFCQPQPIPTIGKALAMRSREALYKPALANARYQNRSS
eukprot:5400126-Amphidinium_carterae.1